ncbi:uncharacterized protein NPIL_605961 [Nephila pilipes]|uniref:Uncharacterized protein n=1 Tax=Nephila pilipes TaxID=299642 RepID=A0A8X6P3H0_NEPPI|nr:uncharacterized protein NPIL_605961 [Nephila pilipes]
MDAANIIFHHVKNNFPEIWAEIEFVIRPHKMCSVINIFRQHLNNIEDINIFNCNQDNIPIFLLEFCKCIRRNFLSPGDAYGILLTCRSTKMYTQDMLDKRHLSDKFPILQNCSHKVGKDLHFEVIIIFN